LRALRIAHLTATYPPYLGGAGTAAQQTADRLARRGHDVEVVTAAADGEAPPSAARVRRLKPALAIGNAPLLPALARLRGHDVLHLHHPFIFGTELTHLARLLGERGTPLVVSYHNRLIGEGGRARLFEGWERTWGRLTARAAARICVVSHAHAATVPELMRHPGKLVEVPNGVDLEAFAPGAGGARIRAEHNISADKIVVVFVAALDRAHYLKRPDLAIDAVAAAGDERLHLVIAGGGEWLPRLRERAAASGLGDRTTFLGPVTHDRLPGVLRASDVLLVTSDLESFGIVLIEAMGCGLPTVSTDLPGIRAVVDDGVTGWTAPAGDAAALGAALREALAAGPAGRAGMGAAGRARCEARYGWEAVVDRVEGVYADVLAQSGRLLR
jgi:glycosyltransferase involved in cell wall biosynthesis